VYQVSQGVAKISKTVDAINDVAMPLAVAFECYQVTKAANEDWNNGTTRNTIETTSKIGGTWLGSFAGKNRKNKLINFQSIFCFIQL
jgi:hypothetical protein